MLAESVESIRARWNGGYVTNRGKHITVENARILSMLQETPGLALAVNGEQSIELAVEHSTDMVSVDPEADLVDQCMKVGGKGHRIGQVAMGYDPDECKAREFALRFRFGVSGWKVMPELPGPVNFDAASENVTFEDLSDGVATGSDPQVHIEAVRKSWMMASTGLRRPGRRRPKMVLQFWADELAPELALL